MKKHTPLRRLSLAATSFACIIVLLTLVAFTARQKLIDDVWLQLGMNKEQGTEGIKRSFINGYLYYYGARNIKSIATGNRVEVAKELLTTAKQYIASDAFKKEYASVRLSAKPQEPTTTIRTKEEVRKDEIGKAEKAIKETEESMKKTTPEVAESLKGVVQMYKEYIAQYKDPANPMIDLFWQGEKDTHERNVKKYKEDLAKWEKNYPEDPKLMIKNRLQQYVDIAATVDFNAELKESYGKRKFVNPVYEGKKTEWKQIYRAGKEVSDYTKEFAKQWLIELK